MMRGSSRAHTPVPLNFEQSLEGEGEAENPRVSGENAGMFFVEMILFVAWLIWSSRSGALDTSHGGKPFLGLCAAKKTRSLPFAHPSAD